jgi:hypothetical protein
VAHPALRLLGASLTADRQPLVLVHLLHAVPVSTGILIPRSSPPEFLAELSFLTVGAMSTATRRDPNGTRNSTALNARDSQLP